MSSVPFHRRTPVRAVLVAVPLLLLLAVAYVGAAWYLGQRLPRNTAVGGVQIGGMEPAQARAALARGLKPRTDTPVTLTAEGRELTLTPAQAGLGFDADASVDGLTGMSLDPRNLWGHLTGTIERDPVVTVDRPALLSAVRDRTKAINRPVKEGSVRFEKGKVVAVRSVEGRRVDAERTADALSRAWPESTTVPVAVERVTPELKDAEIQRFRTQVADKLVSGPVKVVAGKKTFSLPTTAITPALSVKNSNGRLTHRVDETSLVKAATQAARDAGVVREAQSATVTFSEGQPQVVPSKDGQRLKAGSLGTSLTAALTAKDRTARLSVEPVKPKLTTAAAKASLPKGLISVFSTNLTSNADRTENIAIAARTLDGTYVGPGQQFSLNAVLGQRTAAKGYNEAPVIMNGRLTKDYGGGISQLSTTTLNAAFFAGVQIDEFTPHSFYISRYPEGREATISWPDVDQKWTNTTKGGILIKTSVGGGQVTVSFYGTKTYDVTSSRGPRRNVIEPKQITDDSAGCVPQSPTPGFDVTVTRTVKKGGAVVKTDSFDTHYIPEDHVICTHPAAG